MAANFRIPTRQEAYGVGPDGAVVVRPDGYVAWRCRNKPLDPTTELKQVLASMFIGHAEV